MSLENTTSEIGTVLDDRYRLISEGSAQDMGTVYKAYDTQEDRLVVVQVLAPRWSGGPEAMPHLVEVQQAIAGLPAPDLVPIEDAGLVGGRVYLVRPRTRGQTLAEVLARAGRLEPKAAVEITIQLCEALAPLHRAGLAHGGLSPYSVLVIEPDRAPDGAPPGGAQPDRRTVALLDAGLVPAMQAAPMPPGRPWGRTPYLSPEQAAGEQAVPASDVYVVGSLLYEMLTGRPPFRARDEAVLAVQHQRQDPPSLQILASQVPDPLAQIVHQALSKEPATRYRNAGQLAHLLRSQIETAPTEPAQSAERPRQARARDRMVVPPPPAARPARESYLLDDEEWAEEPAGVDWLMVGLLIAAFVAVLGLIPLWRTVYRRYAAPPPPPASDGVQYFQPTWSEGIPKLDEMTFVWYNMATGGSAYLGNAPDKSGDPESPTCWGGGHPGWCATNMVSFPKAVSGRGSFGVWESRLRAESGKYITL